MTDPTLVANLVLAIGVPLCVLATFELWLTWRAERSSKVLLRDLQVQFAILLVVFAFGLIFRNNDTLPFPPLDTDATKLITRYFMLGLALVSSLTFLWLVWRRGNGRH